MVHSGNSARPDAPPGYTLGALLGTGGMGAVWSGVFQETSLPVAIKSSLRSGRRTIAHETQAIARMSHPGILKIYDQVESGEHVLLVMEKAAGSLVGVTMGWPQLAGALLEILDALAHAHAAGILHCDLKPSNILVSTEGRLKVADFGIAWSLQGGDPPRALGSLPYVAPEQIESRWRLFGPWTDLYAVGCLAVELAVGQRLFSGDRERLWVRTQQAPVLPALPGPPEFAVWVRQLLRVDARARFQCAADAAWALTRLAEGEQRVLETFAGTGGVQTSDQTWTAWQEAEPVEAPTPAPAPAQAPPAAPFPPDWRGPEQSSALKRGLGLGLFGMRRIPLAGRDEERDRLWAALQAVHRTRRAGVVTIRGPSGVGKSRLARWLGERAAALGAAQQISVRYTALEEGKGLLQGAARRALSCQDLDAGTCRATLRARGLSEAAIAASLPLLSGEHLPTNTTIKQAHALLDQLCVQRPVVLWLDDVQWGNEAIALAERLEGSDCGVLVVLTAQDEALSPATARRLEAISDEILALGALPPEAHRALLDELLYLEIELAHRVETRTAGNPLFAVQLIRHWIQQGALEEGPRGFALRAGADSQLPEDLLSVWTDRVRAVVVDAQEQEAIERAAALGMQVDRSEWSSICPGPLEDLEQRLFRAALAEPTPRGWKFVHGMLRESIIHTARAAGRWEAHNRRCAAVVQQQTDPGRFHRLGQHLSASGALREACEAWITAIREDASEDDWHNVPTLIEHIRAAIDRLKLEPADPLRLRWLAERARFASRSGRTAEAAALIDEVQRLKVSPWAPRYEHSWARLLCAIASRARDFPKALEHVDARLAAARLLDRDALVLGALGKKLLILAMMPDSPADRIEETHQRLDALRGRVECSHNAAVSMRNVAEAFIWLERFDAARSASRQLILWSRALGSWTLEAKGLQLLGSAELNSGQDAAARVQYQAACALYDAHNHPTGALLRCELAMVALRGGDWAEACGLLEESIAQSERQAHHRRLLLARSLSAWAAAGRGAWPAVEQALDQVAALLEETQYVHEAIALALASCSQLAAEAGQEAIGVRSRAMAVHQYETIGDQEALRRLAVP